MEITTQKIMIFLGSAWNRIQNNPVCEPAVRFFANPGPIQLLLVFMVCSALMVWRLNAVERKGFEGTIAGTLIMPYCSGFSNLAFAFVMGRTGGQGSLVLENCIVNNVTNLTLILGLPALFWGMSISKDSKVQGSQDHKITYFSMLLTIIALLFFTGATWTLSMDKVLDFSDGLLLCGLFLFWQVIHLFDVLKNNVRKKQNFKADILLDLAVTGLCAWAVLYSIEGLVEWVAQHGKGVLSMKYIGILSGILMVVPNALLAVYYSASGRPDIAYSSQVGDAHICIPLCIGLFALFTPIHLTPTFLPGIMTIMAAGCAHFLFTTFMRGVPRIMGLALTLGYGVFVYEGLIN